MSDAEKQSNSASFPCDWPDDCPPGDAGEEEVEVFHIVKQNPLSPDDFLSARELGKSDFGKPCEASGISVFDDIADATHTRAKYPYLGTLIAKADLKSEYGLSKPTPRKFGGTLNSHRTWWPYKRVQRHSIFDLVQA